MNTQTHYRELGIFSDLVSATRKQRLNLPLPQEQTCSSDSVRRLLNFSFMHEYPQDVQLHGTWQKDGLISEELSWSVGYGPPTHAWLLMPADVQKPLPGVLALHDHGAFKYYGREKIANGPQEPARVISKYRENLYEGSAFANQLARLGFVVLVHDAFLWGSRKFPLSSMPPSILAMAELCQTTGQENAVGEPEVDIYNASAGLHELVLEKYFTLLGTSLAGIVCFEDRLALNYLAERPEVDAGRLGCMGLSGGGCRSALLSAVSGRISAAVIAGMMSTYFGLLDHSVSTHTWMLFPAPLPRFCDWPDLVSQAFTGNLLVQYNREDNLFTLEGMQAADRRIRENFNIHGSPHRYTGSFFPGSHKFDRQMQSEAFAWLSKHLQADSNP